MTTSPHPVRPGPDPTVTALWQAMAIGLIYIVLHLVLDMHAHAFQTPLRITAWYPPNAVAITFLLVAGVRMWPVVIAAFILGNLAVWEHWQVNATTLLPPILNAGAVIVGGYLLTRNRQFIPGPYWTLRGLAGFTMIALAISLLSGIGTLGSWLIFGRLNPAILPRIYGEWILGDMIGLLVLTPFLLVIAIPFLQTLLRENPWVPIRRWIRIIHKKPALVLESIVFTALTFLIIYAVFLSNIAQEYNILFLCFLPVLWAVLRYGFVGATLTAAITAFSGLAAALLLTDPSALFPDRSQIHVFQLFTLILVLIGYTLGTTVDELRRAKRSIESHRRELEDTVTLRTRELSREIDDRRRAEDKLRRLNDLLEQRVLERTTALNEARERAERANDAKTRFLQNMSHELHTPLNAILGFAQLLEREELGPLGHKKYEEYAHHIRKAGDHLLSLVGDLLEMASLTEENYPLQCQHLDLKILVEEACRMSEPRAMERQIILRIAHEPDTMVVDGDRHRIIQIMLNLVHNAIKFSPEKSAIRILTYRDGHEAVVEVRDQGPGISPTDIEHVFERFWRSSNNSQLSNEGGMGLGLSIARSLTERHNGTLTLHSFEGEGTSAIIRLPLYNGQSVS